MNFTLLKQTRQASCLQSGLFTLLMSLVLASIGQAQQIFVDDFGDANIDASKWTQVPGSGTVMESEGFLKLNYRVGNAPHTQIRTASDLMRENVTITLKIKPVFIAGNKNFGYWLGDINTGAVTGFVCNFHSTDHFDFSVGKLHQNNGVQMTQSTSKTWTNATDFYAVHEVVITKTGNAYTFSIDGEQIASDTNQSTHPTALYCSLGRPWMENRSGEYGEVWLDEIVVTSSPSPRFRVAVNLPAGLNMIVLPLQPDTPLTASALATTLNATLVIKLDAGNRFVPYIPATQAGENFPIEVGRGYIVNLLTEKTITWEGKPWGEPVPQAPTPPLLNGTWAFVVVGQLDGTDQLPSNPTFALVKNRRTGETVQVPIHRMGTAAFTAVFADLSRRPVVLEGDVLEIELRDGAGNLVMPPIQRHIEADEIRQAYLIVGLDKIGRAPTRSALFQNYPNPFNPETWIPYQLVTESEVAITIYNINGQVVRHLPLGRKTAGVYLHRNLAAYWDGRDQQGQRLSSGVYFYRLQAGDFSQTKRMILLK